MLIPDHETAIDFLNYEAISKSVVSFLKENPKRAMTIGIHGDWGAGKSSVLKMIEAELSQDRDVACLWFNGWAFQGFDDAKTVLIEATIAELCRQRSAVGKVKEFGSRLMRRVDWLKVARRGVSLALTLSTGIPSPDMLEAVAKRLNKAVASVKDWTPEEMESQLSEAASFLKPAEGANVPEVIHEFREEFQALLEEAKIKQLVVLIDDLDRCLPATAIDTLEAIRLFLFVPKTAFVIGADETMIEYAVRQHFPDLPLTASPVPYVRNYLEKLVQVPFRIPALGIQETRTYVTLLLVGALVGEDHAGFKVLLERARNSLNQPWLGSEIRQADVEAVDAGRKNDLTEMYVLAQQIGPTLAEGSKGNPRQIKRFLNALMVRRAIATARGFGGSINPAVLGKLMLAERFQSDFYEHIAGRAMVARDGRVTDIALLEAQAGTSGKKKDAGKKARADGQQSAEPDAMLAKWLEREWLHRWLMIDPALGETDLRPYVFVARDKRVISAAAEPGGLEGLVEKLCGSQMAVRSVEQQVKALSPPDAEQVFAGLRERVLRHGSFSSPPPGFDGMGIVAKHHVRFQTEILSVIGSIDAKNLGVWVVKGWNEVITDAAAIDQLRTLMTQWANQESNAVLKKAAGQAMSGLRKGNG
jgi:KAP family P-loop domain